MNKFIFSDEEISKILLSSPMALPNSPAESGLKGSNIKLFFYDFIRRLMLLLNERYNMIENDTRVLISDHNASSLAHYDIRKMIEYLITRDTELGNAISQHYTEVEAELKTLRVDTDVKSHNISVSAHSDIRQAAASALEKAINAYNLASGKAKIFPVKDVSQMLAQLSEGLNIGDKFVLSDKNVPDFTLFEKNSVSEDAILISDDTEFIPGESYLYNGYLLVASESGIDTSLFAKQRDFSLLEGIVNDLDIELDNAVRDIENQLSLKESSISVVTETTEKVALKNKTEHNLGLRTSIVLELPTEIPNDFECIVNFRSGTVATTFDSPNTIIFTQDDCYKGVLTPISNRIYEINIKNVNGILIAKVGCADYEVIE